MESPEKNGEPATEPVAIDLILTVMLAALALPVTAGLLLFIRILYCVEEATDVGIYTLKEPLADELE